MKKKILRMALSFVCIVFLLFRGFVCCGSSPAISETNDKEIKQSLEPTDIDKEINKETNKLDTEAQR